MYILPVFIGETFPIILNLSSDGKLAFVPGRPVGVIFDQPEDGIEAVFTDDGFSIGESEFSYRVMYEYKDTPDMLAWLKQQRLMMSANILF